MKKLLIIAILFAGILGFSFYKVFANNFTKEVDMGDKKVLVAYYSYSGNTKAAAEKIQRITNADIFEIKPKTEYSKDYDTVVAKAKEENNIKYTPELIDNGNVKDYDIIFVGTPVWWYTMAAPVRTFLSKNNFDGKIIVPFCTHGGGGESSTYTDMQMIVPKAKVLKGYTTYQKSANSQEISNWINSLNF